MMNIVDAERKLKINANLAKIGESFNDSFTSNSKKDFSVARMYLEFGIACFWLDAHLNHDHSRIQKMGSDLIARSLNFYKICDSLYMRWLHDLLLINVCLITDCKNMEARVLKAIDPEIFDPEEDASWAAWCLTLKFALEGDELEAERWSTVFQKAPIQRSHPTPGKALMNAFVLHDWRKVESNLKKAFKKYREQYGKVGALSDSNGKEIKLNANAFDPINLWPWAQVGIACASIRCGADINHDDIWFPNELGPKC